MHSTPDTATSASPRTPVSAPDGVASNGRPSRHRPGSPVAALRTLTIRVLVDVLVVLVLIVLVWVVVGVARDVWISITTGSVDGFKNLSIELLTVFVFIELFHSLSEYMRFQRIRVTHLLDASLAFVLREIWVGMYGGEMDSGHLFALAALVLALGSVRTLAVIYSPSERAADALEPCETMEPA